MEKYMYRYRITATLLSLILSQSVAAHLLYPAVETPTIDTEQLASSAVPRQLISEDNFVFRPVAHPFDADSFFLQYAPDWQFLKESLMHWSGATGVDPRVILTTIAVSENWPSSGTPDATAQKQLKQAVKRIANRLSQQFYNYRSKTDQAVYTSPTLAIVNQLDQFSAWKAWQTQYQTWFGNTDEVSDTTDSIQTDALSSTASSSSSSSTPPDGFFQWPWPTGDRWIPNGPHSNTGSGYPLSSIDVSYDWPVWGSKTYTVVAANAGTVSVLSDCEVRVTNANGWATNYYHMDDIVVSDGEKVTKDTALGVYASTKAAALCDGGSSTGPHVHFSVLYNGRFISLQGISFSGYSVNVGRYSYDDNCNYAYLTKDNQKVCLWNRVDNIPES
jgi:LasA protease